MIMINGDDDDDNVSHCYVLKFAIFVICITDKFNQLLIIVIVIVIIMNIIIFIVVDDVVVIFIVLSLPASMKSFITECLF